LTVPLHDLTLDQAVVNARIAAEQAQVRMEEARHQVGVEVQDGVRNVLVSLKQVELAQRVRELSEKQLAVEREKLQGGRSSNFQLITLQNNLAAAQVRELEATIAYLNAQTLLDQILGTTLETWHIDASIP
jgi:outer membrane protein TolC